MGRARACADRFACMHLVLLFRQPVKVQNLSALKREEDRMELAMALWSEGVVRGLDGGMGG